MRRRRQHRRDHARRRARRPARLLILGEGEQRRELEALVRKYGLERDVQLPGFVDNGSDSGGGDVRSAEFHRSAAAYGLPLTAIIGWLGMAYVVLLPFYDVPQPLREGLAVSGLIATLLLAPLFVARGLIGGASLVPPAAMLLPFAMFFALYLAAALANAPELHPKALNHIGFYLYTFVAYALVPYWLMRAFGTRRFARPLALSAAVCVLIGCYEVSLFYRHGFEAYRDFLSHGAAVGTFAGLPRIRSTFDEPSHFALFLLPVLPMLIWARRPLALALAVIGWIGTLSVSAFAGALVAAAVLAPVQAVRLLRRPRLPTRLAAAALLLAPLALVGLATAGAPLLEAFIDKTTDVASVDPTRWSAWQESLRAIALAPLLGHGPAGYYPIAPTGVFSWYLQVAVEAGIPAVASLLAMLAVTLVVGLRAQVPWTSFAVLATAGQMVSMNHYYIPGLWLLIAFVFARDAERREGDSGEGAPGGGSIRGRAVFADRRPSLSLDLGRGGARDAAGWCRRRHDALPPPRMDPAGGAAS